MPSFIPNEAAASFIDQSEPDGEDFDIVAGGSRRTGVITGCAVTAQGTPDMTVAVAVGAVAVAGAYAVVAAGNVTIGAATASPRFDLVVVNASGVKSVLAGTAGANPVFPEADAATYAVLAAVYIQANATSIAAGNIVDKRVFLNAKQPATYVAASDSPAAFKTLADYVCDGAADEVEINLAISGLSAEGGVVSLFPGSYNTAAAISVTQNKRIWIHGFGARILPAASIVAIDINQGVGGSILGCHVQGVFINGQGRATTTGIRFRNTDRAQFSNARIEGCTTGIHFYADGVAGVVWVEQCAIEHVLVTSCTTGWLVSKNGTGTYSFAENDVRDLGINDCTTGVSFQVGADIQRCNFSNLVVWVRDNQTGWAIDCDVRDSEWFTAFESFGTTGVVGVDVQSNAINTEKHDWHISWTGAFNTRVSLAAGKALLWTEGRATYLAGAARVERYFVSGEAQPRLEFQIDGAGGGAVHFGPGGSTAPDVVLYRDAANRLRLDDRLLLVMAHAQAFEVFGASSFFNVDSSSALVQLANGADLIVYSDGYTTIKASIDGATGNASLGALTIGGGTAIAKHLSGTATWNPANLLSGGMASTTVAVTGAAVGNVVAVGFSSITAAGWLLSASVTSADTVTVTLVNETGGAVDLPSGTVRADVWQH